MNIFPHDIGTYRAQSRQDPTDEYIVDVNELTCTCDAFIKYKTASAENPCAHLEEVLVVHHRALRFHASLMEAREILAENPEWKPARERVMDLEKIIKHGK